MYGPIMILVNDVEKTLRDSILAQGLDVMAVVHANKSELPGLGLEKPAAILLVGSSGSKAWPVFSASNEYLDGAPDSLDRWAKRIGEALAKEFGVHVLFPFDGPPYWPFLTWASRSGLSSPSALGMHIHSEFGLWHAYRFALVIDNAEQKLPKAPVSHAKSACEGCEEQPCLSACPAGAFSPGALQC